METFRYFEQNKGDEFLIIQSNKLNETIDYINTNNIDSIYVGDHWGYELDNIEPLFELKGIKRLQYQESYKMCSMAGLEKFKDLEYLRIDGAHKINLGSFKNLKYLNFKWDKKYTNLAECKSLEEIDLWSFNTKEKDFSNFPFLPKLKKMKFFRGNATSLSGLHLPNSIEELEFHLYSKLKNIEKIREFNSLELLRFETCKKLENHKKVSYLTNLRELFFSDTGKVSDIKFISEMKNLNTFGFLDTEIVNGDLSPLDDDRFEFIGFDNKRHYNRKYEDLKPVS